LALFSGFAGLQRAATASSASFREGRGVWLTYRASSNPLARIWKPIVSGKTVVQSTKYIISENSEKINS